ncbi:MAG: 3-isopropylmalate dehydrogenase [Alphaproteobacteria bacterium MarineAlpha9_Bin4]|nr:MAG: 3-isopropylmalate dehydrogenase [Alphaproteobacteria bacterium MarineAlpha9_Bin4]|tara:strand:+ start:284 stop:1408 length:1125 start_codon:yes stop_codon:yes gene_type:complete
MNKKTNILLLPGDGIGPEVCSSVKEVINCLNNNTEIDFLVDEDLVGGCSYERHKVPITDKVIAKAKNSDGILLGSVGSPIYESLPFELRPERGLLKLRKELDLFANIRPAKVFNSLVDASSLKRDIVKNMDIVVLRELTGGIYFGEPRGIENLSDGQRKGINTEVYTTNEIIRLGRVGFEIASLRKKAVHSVEKANVMESGVLWREEIHKLKEKEFPDISLKNMYADNCAMQLVKDPKQFDVIVTGNLFGDILSDISAELTGSLGMLPSASLGEFGDSKKRKSLYEPVHGSAPDIAGKNIANPIAMILSLSMFLNYTLNFKNLSDLLEKSVEETLNRGYRTKDIMQKNCNLVSTSEMGNLITENLETLLIKNEI